MKIQSSRFNIILLLLGCLCLLAACKTTKLTPEEEALRKKYKQEKTMIQLHLGDAPSSSGRRVQIFRERPIDVVIDPIPFLDWRDIVDAQIVEEQYSGFA